MGPSRFKNMVLCFSGDFKPSDVEIRRWTEHNGGEYSKKVTDSTTHLIVSEANWRARIPEVRAARKDEEIKIVTYDWFDDKLRNEKGRVSEAKYLWYRIDDERAKQEEKEQKAAEREKKKKAKEEARRKKDSEKVDYSGAFLQHVGERGGDADSGEEEEEGEGKNSHGARFEKGAKAAKKDLLSDNHHVYMDQTGFSYSIVLTKTCLKLSRVDRVQLTVSLGQTTRKDFSKLTCKALRNSFGTSYLCLQAPSWKQELRRL